MTAQKLFRIFKHTVLSPWIIFVWFPFTYFIWMSGFGGWSIPIVLVLLLINEGIRDNFE